MGKNIKAQIWIETVIYTLIGLAIIGLLLSIVKPAIERKQDQILIESSLEMLSSIESTIEDVKYYGQGNTRTLNVKIKKGKLIIDSKIDEIWFSMESKYRYSELGEEIKIGKINILTTEKTKKIYNVKLSLNYVNSLDLTYNGEEKIQTFQSSPTPHIILVANKGKTGELLQVDFS